MSRRPQPREILMIAALIIVTLTMTGLVGVQIVMALG